MTTTHHARVGVMQGRLLPPTKGRIQAFPWGRWEEEFPKARQIGLDAIEWLFEAEDFERNPIWTKEGAEDIRKVSRTHGVQVPSICADYFMAHGLISADPSERRRNREVLEHLLRQAAGLGMERILLPILEDVAVRASEDLQRLGIALAEVLPLADSLSIRLGLETEMPAQQLCSFIDTFKGPPPYVYYDLGNAASLGYDLPAEVRLMRHRIAGVHVKDRVRGGGTVPLGTGAATLPQTIPALVEVGFRGPYILQAARAGDEIATVAGYLKYVRSLIHAAEH